MNIVTHTKKSDNLKILNEDSTQIELTRRRGNPRSTPSSPSQITLRPSFSVAINIPLCCLSQNYRNTNRGNTYIYIYIWKRDDRGTTRATNSRQFATRIESQTPFNAIPPRPKITRIESTRCNANNIVPPPLASLLCRHPSSRPPYRHPRLSRLRVPRGANYNVRNVNSVCRAVNTAESSSHTDSDPCAPFSLKRNLVILACSFFFFIISIL